MVFGMDVASIESSIEKIPQLKEYYATQKNLLHAFFAFYTQLTEEEQEVIRILVNKIRATSIGSIRKEIAREMIKKSTWMNLKKNIEPTKEMEEILMGEKDINEMNARWFERFVSEFNKKYPDLRIPSYHKIKSVLQTLESMNIVQRRKNMSIKADELWTLTPEFAYVVAYVLSEASKKENFPYTKLYYLLTGEHSPNETII